MEDKHPGSSAKFTKLIASDTPGVYSSLDPSAWDHFKASGAGDIEEKPSSYAGLRDKQVLHVFVLNCLVPDQKQKNV